MSDALLNIIALRQPRAQLVRQLLADVYVYRITHLDVTGYEAVHQQCMFDESVDDMFRLDSVLTSAVPEFDAQRPIRFTLVPAQSTVQSDVL